MTINTFFNRVLASLTLEKIVRFAGRRTADVVYYFITVFREPKIATTIFITHRITKVDATNYKRTNYDPGQIFEDAIDAIAEAY